MCRQVSSSNVMQSEAGSFQLQQYAQVGMLSLTVCVEREITCKAAEKHEPAHPILLQNPNIYEPYFFFPSVKIIWLQYNLTERFAVIAEIDPDVFPVDFKLHQSCSPSESVHTLYWENFYQTLKD